MKAIVLGGALNVWSEVERAKEQLGEFDFVVGTNHAGRDAPFHVDHWCSVHGDLLCKWYETRAERGGTCGQLWTAKGPWKSPARYDFKRVVYRGGSSGLLAVDVAIHNGAKKIVLCGVPLTVQASHYDDKHNRPWKEGPRYRAQWLKRYADLSPLVRSYAGWTKDNFGKPDLSWINDNSY